MPFHTGMAPWCPNPSCSQEHGVVPAIDFSRFEGPPVCEPAYGGCGWQLRWGLCPECKQTTGALTPLAWGRPRSDASWVRARCYRCGSS